jgi:hypothetical protein
MDAAPSVEIDDNTAFPAEPPITANYKKPEAPAPSSRYDQVMAEAEAKMAAARKKAAEKSRESAKSGAEAAKAEAAKAETAKAETAAVKAPEAVNTTPAAAKTPEPEKVAVTAPTQTAEKPAETGAAAATKPQAPRKEIVSLRELSTGFNDAEYEKQTGTLPVLGELTDEFSGGKRISGKTTRTDAQIQLMRKQEALAMNILSEDSSNAGTVRAERIIYDQHEKNENKKRLFGLITLCAANLLLIIIGAVGIFFFENDNSGLAFMFRAAITMGVVGFIPQKFIQKLISPFMVLTALLFVFLGLAGQDSNTTNIVFYTIGTVAGLFGFTIRFFFGSVKSLFIRRKP